jgi:hypothetical protein
MKNDECYKRKKVQEKEVRFTTEKEFESICSFMTLVIKEDSCNAGAPTTSDDDIDTYLDLKECLQAIYNKIKIDNDTNIEFFSCLLSSIAESKQLIIDTFIIQICNNGEWVVLDNDDDIMSPIKSACDYKLISTPEG